MSRWLNQAIGRAPLRLGLSHSWRVGRREGVGRRVDGETELPVKMQRVIGLGHGSSAWARLGLVRALCA